MGMRDLERHLYVVTASVLTPRSPNESAVPIGSTQTALDFLWQAACPTCNHLELQVRCHQAPIKLSRTSNDKSPLRPHSCCQSTVPMPEPLSHPGITCSRQRPEIQQVIGGTLVICLLVLTYQPSSCAPAASPGSRFRSPSLGQTGECTDFII